MTLLHWPWLHEREPTPRHASVQTFHGLLEASPVEVHCCAGAMRCSQLADDESMMPGLPGLKCDMLHLVRGAAGA
eukprot:5570864-Amphidinium_carterae.1